MEKIYLDIDTFIWKTKLNRISDKSLFLKEAYTVINSMPDIKTDGFGYTKYNKNINFIGDIDINNKLDEVVQLSTNLCKELYIESNKNIFNRVNTDSWINVVRSKNPVQIEFKHEDMKGINKYHIHTEINKKFNSFAPHYTYVYYIQMPDVMNELDGVLFFKGKNKKEYWIRPEEDDLIIMEADMPHAPNNAPNSTIDRIVLAGNIGFEFIKKEKSLI
jgi:hypothetical protein